MIILIVGASLKKRIKIAKFWIEVLSTCIESERDQKNFAQRELCVFMVFNFLSIEM